MRGQGPKATYASIEKVCESVLQDRLGSIETCVDINRLAESLGIHLDRAPPKPLTTEQRLIALRGPQDEATRQRAAQRRRQADRLGTAKACGQIILTSWLEKEGAPYQVERCAYVLLMPKALVQKHCKTLWGDGPIPVYGEEFFLPEHRETIQKIADLLDVPFLDLKKRLDQLGLLAHKPEDDPVYEATWKAAYQKSLEDFLAQQKEGKKPGSTPEGKPEEPPKEPAKPKKSRSSRKGKTQEKTDSPEKPRRTRKPKTPPV